MANGLSVQPLIAQGGFNWIFLVEILVCGILALFFLFYFNRLFATVVAYLIRAWTWHKYRAYIDISALQISLLGGRIFFKSIRYHAHNVTVLVYEGHITWRYWLRSVQGAEVFEVEDLGRKGKERPASGEDGKSSSDEKGKSRSRSIGKEEQAGGKPKKDLPCRISVKVAGVEAFVYNRSPVYDIILEQTRRKAGSPTRSAGTDEKISSARTASSSDQSDEKKTSSSGFEPQRANTYNTTGTTTLTQTSSHGNSNTPEVPAFLRMFPIRLECRRVAAALGNENTTHIIAAKLEKAAGTIDAGHAGLLDLYKLLFSFDLENINVTMRPNRDFKQPQLDAARRVLREKEAVPMAPKRFDFKFVRKMKKQWQALTRKFAWRKSVNGSLRTASLMSEVDGAGMTDDQLPGQAQWQGLARYLDDKELDEHDEWRDVEYAKASTLADIEKLHMRFYFDIPGIVPDGIVDGLDPAYFDDINGSKPPDYGLDFAVHGGLVTYGPWADRQRINLQQVFIPASYVDAEPAARLKPGDTRAWSLFKIFISVEKDLTLRIPSRELSKDDKWQGRAEKSKAPDGTDMENVKRKGKHGKKHRHTRRRKGKQGNPGLDARPYAWLDVTVKSDSTINYTMGMFARPSGYTNKLDLDVKGTEITSSVNHGLLWRTGGVSLDADLSQPVPWNSLREWPFNIVINDVELFILRDHMFLIIDLVNDWSAGPPGDFYTFVPYMYNLRMLFRNMTMYLNVNDANIVNDPADFDKNDFLTLDFGSLDATLDISLEQHRPVRNSITFDVLATEMRMRMLSPTRSTFYALLKDKLVAEMPKLTMKGSFSGHQEERPGLTDTLRFDIVGSGLNLKAYGFLVRQLINVKENMFGDYMHFKTLEEFQGADEDLDVANAKTASIPKPKSINELDVILCIIAEDVTIMAPTNIYSCNEFVRIELPVANLDLRILSYYLDMGLQLSPISFLSGTSSIDDESPIESASSTQMFVKHVDLDGHRGFGLPPDEPAYVNQWNIDVGAITGELSSSFVHRLAMAGRAFVFGFEDRENALPLSSPSVFNDVTFVQVRTDIIRVWLHVGKDALLLSIEPVEVVTNDCAGDTFSQRVSVTVPRITFACVDATSASRHRALQESQGERERSCVRTYAFFQTGLAINVVMRKLHFEEERRKQQLYLKEHDQRTGRIPFLQRRDVPAVPSGDSDFEPPAMPYPSLPPPLDQSGSATRRPASIKSVPSFVSGRGIRPKSSSTSLSASLKREAAALQPRVHQLQQDESTLIAPPGSSSSSSRASSRNSDFAKHGQIGDRRRAQPGLPPSTMAFSSSFAEPYFPLDTIKPDESKVPDYDQPAIDDATSSASSVSETIEDPDVDHDVAQVSVLIQLTPGIRAYLEPRLVTTASKLLKKALPKHPDEVMDAFQMDVLGTVAARQEQRHGSNQTLEIQIKVPTARLRVVNPALKDGPDDQMDIGLTSVQTMVRIKNQALTNGNSKEALTVHATVDSIRVSLGYPQASPDGHSIEANLDDVLVWVAVETGRSIHAAIGDILLTVSAGQADYLTDLILRLVPLAEGLKTKVTAPLSLKRQQLLHLTDTLIQNGEDTGDPPCLSRMSYILRASPNHYRNQDSWKILMRFRQILQSLPPESVVELKSKYKKAGPDSASEASVKALENWAQWRNWDVPNIHQTVAFQALVKDEVGSVTKPHDEKPLTFTARLEYLRLAIESGESSNEVVMEETSLGLDSTPPTAPTGLMLVDENTRTKTMLQFHSNSIGISVNWSVFAIVERVLPLVEKLETLSKRPVLENHGSALARFEDPLLIDEFHIVASTDNGSISLQSINLRHISRADGLKVSIIGTSHQGEQYGSCVSAIINSDAAITELHGPSRRLWHTMLTSPSMYVDFLTPLPDAPLPPSVTVAVAYKVLHIEVLEQAPGLLRIVDSVIIDEVSKVMNLVRNTKSRPANAPQEIEADNASRGPVKIHVALLAGELKLEIALLQSLSYQLQGTTSSIRVAPSFVQDQAWGIDFDMGHQLHCFVNTSSNKRSEQNILDVPPINGHVGVEMNQDMTSLSIASNMDRIDIDATAIQGVLAVVTRPEVQNVISSIKAGIAEVQQHVETLQPKSRDLKQPDPPAGKQIAFDVRFALLGIRVAATTQAYGSSTAEVEFGIGPLHVVASNRGKIEGRTTFLPEVRASIRDIGARLQVNENSKQRPCGNISLGLELHFESQTDDDGNIARELRISSQGLAANAYPDTAAIAVDVINHLEDRIKGLDLSTEMEYLRRLRDSRRGTVIQKISGKQVATEDTQVAFSAADLLAVSTTVELTNIQVAWIVDQSFARSAQSRTSDLVLTLERIEFTNRGGREARLTIQDLQLQLTRQGDELNKRSWNSALLPEISFSVAYWHKDKNHSLAFKAAGKPLEIRLESKFIVPVNALQRSILFAIERFKVGTATWKSTPTSTGAPRASFFNSKLLASLLVEADFAGAVIYIQGSGPREHTLLTLAASSQQHGAQHGRYGQFAAEGAKMQAALRAPGFAMKVEYNSGAIVRQPTVIGELRVDASNNMLLPSVVPLLLEVSNSVKEVMQDQEEATSTKIADTPEAKPAQRFFEDESIVTADPTAFFGKTKVDLGLRVCRQEFGLTCQPIAKIDAKAQLDDLYITMNTINTDEHGHFFAVSAVVTKLTAQVKHVYSREPTFSFDMDSIVLSVLNSKHLSGPSGISAVLKINPTRTFINGKQLQDLLLFREIWLPPEIRATQSVSSPAPQPASSRQEDYFAQRYQTVAAAAAFPWNATISIAELAVDLDLGQSIGKPSFTIKNLWASQAKSSNSEQNLCVGMDEMAMNSTGRMSGFIRLNKLGVRTSIKWPQDAVAQRKTPLIQASVGFERLRAKAAFDYQAFAFGDIEGFDFLMYNVHQFHGSAKDRLVAVLDCEKAYVFCTSTSPAQALGLFQAFDRLIQEKQAAYMQSLSDIEKHLRRQSTVVPTRFGPRIPESPVVQRFAKSSISLHTDVVLTMGTISFGVFPSTFFDSQVLKLEANNIQGRFAVGLEKGRIQSGLGMTLGQLQVALASVRRLTTVPKALDISVDEVVNSAVNAKGGTILRVPKVVASMQTWQAPDSYNVDYIFKSLFDGKIDVGWNLSRIDFIKNMWVAQSRSLASRLGKALPESAVKITSGPVTEGEAGKDGDEAEGQKKITAEVNLPQSRYEYNALVKPIIETPQLRDMGEATPPLEWIGLHRDRLPNVTHQVIIVSLLEVAKEVEDAYERILGSS